jgi:hypothetical protein
MIFGDSDSMLLNSRTKLIRPNTGERPTDVKMTGRYRLSAGTSEVEVKKMLSLQKHIQ